MVIPLTRTCVKSAANTHTTIWETVGNDQTATKLLKPLLFVMYYFISRGLMVFFTGPHLYPTSPA